jgi:hypothetical protein
VIVEGIQRARPGVAVKAVPLEASKPSAAKPKGKAQTTIQPSKRQ